MPFKTIPGGVRASIVQRVPRFPAVAVVVALSLSLQGCTLRGAPSYEIFGAYFPLWLLSAIAGFVGALIAHRIFVSTGWAQIVPFQLSVCLAIGLTVAVLFWLSGTGQLL
ncbi:hypothetical protein [Paraburkholderia haematera]|uniref:Uncharacterized protein n=1 Tax=Paraburkholderia haematera TaxID=2793077 RepID=A0ABM8R5V3_9BURK|nr:hypothetical protein [Paraburkholderia haematera]CAE6734461.1 hypothetical protein R69888_02219 [Paraburkholderia haematera]